MGSFTSKAFEDLMEDAPTTPVSGKRVLTFDPRSPTCGITRTPIQVEKTPDRLIDPRSPTCGITRTPILNFDEEHPMSLNSGEEQDVSGSGEQANLSLSFTEEDLPSEFGELSMKDALESLPPLDLDVDSYIDADCDAIQLIRRSSSEPKISVFSETPEDAAPKAESKNTTRNRKKAKALFNANSNITDVSQDSPRSPLGILPASHRRSPLASRRNNKDVNSPLSIVQRKQSNKLGMLKSQGNTPIKVSANSCHFEAIAAAIDKENISM